MVTEFLFFMARLPVIQHTVLMHTTEWYLALFGVSAAE